MLHVVIHVVVFVLACTCLFATRSEAGSPVLLVHDVWLWAQVATWVQVSTFFLRHFNLIMTLDSFEPPDMFSFAPMLSVNARPPDGFVPPCMPRRRRAVPASQFVHAGILGQPAEWEQFRSFLSQLICRLAEQIHTIEQTALSDKPQIVFARKILNLGSALCHSQVSLTIVHWY